MAEPHQSLNSGARAKTRAFEAFQALLVGVMGSLPAIATDSMGVFALLAPYMVAMRSMTRCTVLFVWLGAAVIWAISQWWTFQVASLGFVPLIAVQSSWLVLTVWSLYRIRVAFGWKAVPVTLPFVWTGIEFLRAEVFMGGYAWGLTSQSLIDTSLARIAPLTGVYGVTFVCAAISGVGVFFAERHLATRLRDDVSQPPQAQEIAGKKAAWYGAAVGVSFVLIGLLLRFSPPSSADRSRGFPVASVQTNVPQSNKTYWTLEAEVRDYRAMQMLSEKATATGPGLIIWPETMMPGISIEPAAVAEMEAKGLFFNLKEPMPEELGTSETRIKATAFWEALALHSEKINTPLLIGEEGLDGFSLSVASDGAVDMSQRARFNSAYLVQAGKVTGERYDKMELTPFGEYMPVIGRFPWLQDKLLGLAAAGMKFDLSAGTKRTVFTLPFNGSQVRFVSPICFEITESTVCRDLVFANGERRADFMVNLSNDGWFQGSDAAREQHLRIAQWRCMELGTPMVRSANTGISAVIDAHGRIVKRGVADNVAGTQVAGVMAADLPLPTGEPTLYARTGNWLGWGCLGAWMIVTTIAVVRSRKQAKQG